MGDSIYPGAESATPVECRQASPESEMDVLQEILPPIRIPLVPLGQPDKRTAQHGDRFVVERILIRASGPRCG